MPSVLKSLLLAVAVVVSNGQDFTRNATGFSGTWTSGSGGVLTGPVSRNSCTSFCELFWSFGNISIRDISALEGRNWRDQINAESRCSYHPQKSTEFQSLAGSIE